MKAFLDSTGSASLTAAIALWCAITPSLKSLASILAPMSVASFMAFAHFAGSAFPAVDLANAASPFMKEVPWNSGLFLQAPGKADPAKWAKAIKEATDMGAKMDAKLLREGVMAHHKAIAAVSEADPVLSKKAFI